MAFDLLRAIAAAQLGANALALPARVGQATQQADLERAFLQNNAGVLGLSPGAVDQYAPKPALPGPIATGINSALGGYPGKILGGVGEVGAILSSLLGGPLATAAPRLPLSALTTVAGLKASEANREAARTERVTSREQRQAQYDIVNEQGQERIDIARGRADKAGGEGKLASPEKALRELAFRQGHPGKHYFPEYEGLTDDQVKQKALGKTDPLGRLMDGGGAGGKDDKPPAPAGAEAASAQLPDPGTWTPAQRASYGQIKQQLDAGTLSLDDARTQLTQVFQAPAGTSDSIDAQIGKLTGRKRVQARGLYQQLQQLEAQATKTGKTSPQLETLRTKLQALVTGP